jgi:hypothetical protein
MLRLVVVRRLAWRLADLGIMRERIEEGFKRRMVVRGHGSSSRALALIEDGDLEAEAVPDAGSVAR